jgi:hypothetical protein
MPRDAYLGASRARVTASCKGKEQDFTLVTVGGGQRSQSSQSSDARPTENQRSWRPRVVSVCF